MRIYDILNPYKLLCEEVQQLDEALTTDFSIGFELEGVCTRDGYTSSNLPGYHSNRQPTGVVKELLDDINRELGFGEGKIERDGSLNPSSDKGGWTFEYGSPIIPFNPANINKIYKFLKKLPDLQIYTNESCGFHTHMSFKGIEKTNTAWAMCCLSIDEELQAELRKLKTPSKEIGFVSDWSREKLFDNIRKKLKSGNYSDISELLSTEDKYNLVRVHPAGTMEWRGPRNFLNDADINEIHEYIKKLYKVIFGISKIINAKEYTGSGITINRKEIESKVTVTDDFESLEQEKIDRKKQSMLERIKKHPEVLNSMNYDKLYNFIKSNEDDLWDAFNSYYNGFVWGNFKNVKTPQLNALFKIMSDYNKDFFWRTVNNFYGAGVKIMDKLDDSLMSEYIKYALSEYIINRTDYNLERLEIDNFLSREENKKHILNALMKLPFNSYALEIIRDYNIEIPLEYYIKILNSKNFYHLALFDNLPVKIQRMMIRKSPYMVQYIQHIDPQLLSALKQKYPDIEQHVLGEI